MKQSKAWMKQLTGVIIILTYSWKSDCYINLQHGISTDQRPVNNWLLGTLLNVTVRLTNKVLVVWTWLWIINKIYRYSVKVCCIININNGLGFKKSLKRFYKFLGKSVSDCVKYLQCSGKTDS